MERDPEQAKELGELEEDREEELDKMAHEGDAESRAAEDKPSPAGPSVADAFRSG